MINCSEAKKISLVSILDKIGAKKIKQNTREVWYISPFRNETTASFKIDLSKNIWFDHGAGKGGNVLDFIMSYYKCDLKESLQVLNNESFSFHQPIFVGSAIEKQNNYKMLSVCELKNPQLIEYVTSRRISYELAFKYCLEIRYTLNYKEYYSIGFLNEAGGYELRNKYIKMCLGEKAPTVYTNNAKAIILFEGFIDYLSFLMLYPKAEKHYDYLILNSVATLNNILIKQYKYFLIQECFNTTTQEYINTNINVCKYSKIICCFDNDKAGSLATKKVIDQFPIQTQDGRILYPNHKDLNDYLSTK